MSLFDFFFPEQAQASHLRRLAEQQHRSQRHDSRSGRRDQEQTLRISELEDRVLDLERDLGFVTLLLGSLLHAANNKGVVTRDEVCSVLEELDAHDGFEDGRLDIESLRAWGTDNGR